MKVIIVEGGLIQKVYSARREKIHVFEYDGDDEGEQKREAKEANDLIKKYKLKKIY